MLSPGQQFITMVPASAALEVEANIPGREDGYVHVGDRVTVKFDTFPYSRYGVAHGTVRIMSPDSFTPQEEQRNPTGTMPAAPNSADPYYRARVSVGDVAVHGTPGPFHYPWHALDGRHRRRKADRAGLRAAAHCRGCQGRHARALMRALPAALAAERAFPFLSGWDHAGIGGLHEPRSGRPSLPASFAPAVGEVVMAAPAKKAHDAMTATV